jgi:nucleoside-diphosphate-sugar epimerase
MEKIVESNCEQFHIFRLPQVVGVTNSPTLVNYLFMSIKNNIPLTINKNSTRNLIHVDDVVKIVSYLIDNKIYCQETTNIATPHNMMVLDIVLKIEEIMQIKANYKLIEFGAKQNIDISKIQELNMESDIFDVDYTDEIISKYYAQASAFYNIKNMTK